MRVLVGEGPSRVNELIAMGAMFDRDREGRLQLAREGGHSLPRVVHAGGAATGAEIERALVEEVRETAVACWEQWFALDLLVDGGRCVGVAAMDHGGQVIEIRSRHVLLATGGAGQLYAATTNPLQSTGDGLAMALRAGAACADIEFVQFHPTALLSPKMPRPLLSEALRGHGALIRDLDGKRFVDELQPRDVVARAITRKMLEEDADHMLLDATGLERFDERFPTIAADLRSAGLDPARRLPARSRPPPTTTAAASSPTSTAPRPFRACGRRARSRARASTAPTASPATRCWRGWCSGLASSRPSVAASTDRRPRARCGPSSASAAGGDVIGGRAVEPAGRPDDRTRRAPVPAAWVRRPSCGTGCSGR